MTNELFRELLDGKIHVRSLAALRRAAFMAAVSATALSFHLVPADMAKLAAAAEDARVQAKMTADALDSAPKTRYGNNIDEFIYDETHAYRRHFLNKWVETTGPTPPDSRQQALAAKQRQGKGPPSSTSWRGRERNIQFRSQS